MKRAQRLNVAIVGGGSGCKAIMDMMFAEKLHQLRMKIVGVACTNPRAVGYRYAQEKGIYTTTDYRGLYEVEDLDMIIEVTGRDEVAKEIARTKPGHVRLIDHVAARLFWEIFHIEEERLKERKRSEERLRRSEASLAEAQRIAHLGNWDWNIVTNELGWSDEIYRIFGLLPQEFGATYEAFLDSVHPDDREFVKKAVDEALYEDKPYSIDHRIVLPDGTERIVHEQAGIMFDNAGKPIRMIGTVQDITERKRAEGALEKSERELRQLSSELLNVQETERKRISRELHDSIGQSLAAIKFGLENALDKIRLFSDREAVASLEALLPVIQWASEEVRRIHTDLRPSVLDDLGIIATISWFCREFEKLYSNIRIEKEIGIEEEDVPETLKIVVFRIFQEALNNIAKYGRADLVRIALREVDGRVELAIEDNGRGFDVDVVTSGKGLTGGFGLTSMKERAELSGGAFAVESILGAGTLVRAWWPTGTQ